MYKHGRQWSCTAETQTLIVTVNLYFLLQYIKGPPWLSAQWSLQGWGEDGRELEGKREPTQNTYWVNHGIPWHSVYLITSELKPFLDIPKLLVLEITHNNMVYKPDSFTSQTITPRFHTSNAILNLQVGKQRLTSTCWGLGTIYSYHVLALFYKG